MKRILTVSVLAVFMGSMAVAQTPFRTDFRQEIRTPEAINLPFHMPASPSADGLGIYGSSAKGVVSSIGSPVIPVILVAYQDRDFMPASTDEKISRWFNEEGYSDERLCKGSIADYFRDNSYGMFTPRFEVVKRVVLSHGLDYYGVHSGSSVDSRRTEMVTEAIDLATAGGVDFSKYDTDGNGVPLVSIIFAGPGEQEDYGDDYERYMWAHYNSLSYNKEGRLFRSYLMTNESFREFDSEGHVTNEYMTGIGTFCHEFCHALGLPDIYDVNGNGSQTPQYWDVMDYQFMNNGFRPGCLNAYERCCLGWLELTPLTAASEGKFTLEPLDVDNLLQREGSRAYIFKNPAADTEYFILENRQQSRWHVARNSSNVPLLGSGMLVWHIDYAANAWMGNRVNTTPSHQRVKVVCADGEWQEKKLLRDTQSFPGDLFPGAKEVTQFDNTIEDFYTGGFATVLHSITELEDGTVSFVIGEESGISAVTNHPALAGTYYNLAGRTMRQPEGIHIINGKKIIK